MYAAAKRYFAEHEHGGRGFTATTLTRGCAAEFPEFSQTVLLRGFRTLVRDQRDTFMCVSRKRVLRIFLVGQEILDESAFNSRTRRPSPRRRMSPRARSPVVTRRGADERVKAEQDEPSSRNTCPLCGTEDNRSVMVQCEDPDCRQWTHAECDRIGSTTELRRLAYFCPACRKLRDMPHPCVLIPDLAGKFSADFAGTTSRPTSRGSRRGDPDIPLVQFSRDILATFFNAARTPSRTRSKVRAVEPRLLGLPWSGDAVDLGHTLLTNIQQALPGPFASLSSTKQRTVKAQMLSEYEAQAAADPPLPNAADSEISDSEKSSEKQPPCPVAADDVLLQRRLERFARISSVAMDEAALDPDAFSPMLITCLIEPLRAALEAVREASLAPHAPSIVRALQVIRTHIDAQKRSGARSRSPSGGAPDHGDIPGVSAHEWQRMSRLGVANFTGLGAVKHTLEAHLESIGLDERGFERVFGPEVGAAARASWHGGAAAIREALGAEPRDEDTEEESDSSDDEPLAPATLLLLREIGRQVQGAAGTPPQKRPPE